MSWGDWDHFVHPDSYNTLNLGISQGKAALRQMASVWMVDHLYYTYLSYFSQHWYLDSWQPGQFSHEQENCWVAISSCHLWWFLLAWPRGLPVEYPASVAAFWEPDEEQVRLRCVCRGERQSWGHNKTTTEGLLSLQFGQKKGSCRANRKPGGSRKQRRGMVKLWFTGAHDYCSRLSHRSVSWPAYGKRVRSGGHCHLILVLALGFAIVEAVGYTGLYVIGWRTFRLYHKSPYGGWVGEILISLEEMRYGLLASKGLVQTEVNAKTT